jgi:precorrin-3B methylase
LLACELLAEAQRRVQNGWCQRTAARDSTGRSVLPSDPAAASWSAAGAVMAAAQRNVAANSDADPAVFALAMAAFSMVVGAGPQSWNDRPECTADDVASALADAIELLGCRTRPPVAAAPLSPSAHE